MTRTFIGRAGDFDFLAREYRVVNRRLRRRHVGSSEWDQFESEHRGLGFFEGGISIDEVKFRSQGWRGLTFRTLDRGRERWSIYWVNSADGLLQPPVHGGFDGDEGEFHGEDTDEGRPVLVRFRWRRPPTHAPRWEQAFSLDGRAWEVNWTMEFFASAGAPAAG